MYHKAGMDVYENGLNISMTNFFHYCSPVFCNKEVVDDYKKSFNRLFRDRDNSSILEFFVVSDYLKNSCIDDDFRKLLEIITDGANELDAILENFNSSHFDSYLTAFIYQINFWGQKASCNFDVYVDKYKNWVHFTKHLEMIKNIKDEQTIGTDRRTLDLPLKLNDLIETDSSENSVVQIADLMAGIANHYFKCIINGNNEDELFKKLNEEKIYSFIQTIVWPHNAFTPQETDTVYAGDLLEPFNFFRIHNSCLINLAHVTKYTKGDGGSVLMSDGVTCEVSRRKKNELMSRLSLILI